MTVSSHSINEITVPVLQQPVIVDLRTRYNDTDICVEVQYRKCGNEQYVLKLLGPRHEKLRMVTVITGSGHQIFVTDPGRYGTQLNETFATRYVLTNC